MEGGPGKDMALSPPDPARVAARSLVLSAVIFRSFMEIWPSSRHIDEARRRAIDWLDRLGVGGEVEPREAAVLAAPPFAIDEEVRIAVTWLTEGLLVLAWALGRKDLPRHDDQVDPEELTESLGLLEVDAARGLLAAASLRPRAELARVARSLLAVHWRLREFARRPGPMDFAHRAREAGLDLDPALIPLVDGDLAIGGRTIAEAPRESVEDCLGIAHERHRAMNWLLGYESVFSKVPTPVPDA